MQQAKEDVRMRHHESMIKTNARAPCVSGREAGHPKPVCSPGRAQAEVMRS